jgi:hypothetical protein
MGSSGVATPLIRDIHHGSLSRIAVTDRHAPLAPIRLVTWTKETIDTELAELLRGYGFVFQTNFP